MKLEIEVTITCRSKITEHQQKPKTPVLLKLNTSVCCLLLQGWHASLRRLRIGILCTAILRQNATVNYYGKYMLRLRV